MTPLSLILFFGAFYLVTNNIILTTVITVSVLAHELAHGAYIATLGHRFNLIFVPLVGAGTIPKETKRFYNLPEIDKVKIYISGPAISVFIALLGLLATQIPIDFFHIWGKYFLTINTLLCSANLVPIMQSDGNQIVRSILQSIDHSTGKVILSIYFFIHCFIGLCAILRLGSDLGAGWWLLLIIVSAISILPHYPINTTRSQTPMNEKQTTLIALIYSLISILGIIILILHPI